jgi:hypothetical protein
LSPCNRGTLVNSRTRNILVLSSRNSQPARWAATAFYAASICAIVISALYALSIIYGIWRGFALPTAAIFSAPLGAHIAGIIESLSPYTILGFAASGAGIAWSAARRGSYRNTWRRGEVRLIRLWSQFGLLVILCLLLLSASAGGWGGRIRESDLNYMALAGLVP